MGVDDAGGDCWSDGYQAKIAGDVCLFSCLLLTATLLVSLVFGNNVSQLKILYVVRALISCYLLFTSLLYFAEL